MESVKKLLVPIYQYDNMPPELKKESSRNYSPGFRGSRILTGIDSLEQQMYLPEYLGISAQSQDFQSAVEDFFVNFSFNVPYHGIEIETGLDDNGKPIELLDYILGKMVIDDRNVATGDDIENAHFFSFKLIDLEEKEKALEASHALIKKAVIAYTALIQEADVENKLQQICVLFRKKIDKSVVEIYKMKTSELERGAKIVAETLPDKFIATLSDKDLKLKSVIATALDLNIITNSGDAYFIGEDLVAKNITELLGVLKSTGDLYTRLVHKVESVKKEMYI
jgi:hypothetical protein